jgi:chromosome segregation ATPase
MRAVIKLEKRFKRALAKLDTGVDAQASADEIAKLSKQIEKLELSGADKDTKNDALQAELKTLSESGGDSEKALAEMGKAQADTQNEVLALQDSLKQTQAAEAAALKQVGELESKLKDAEAKTDGVGDASELGEKLKASEEKVQELFNRIRNLRGASRQIREGLDDNAVKAEDVNSALEAELEALQGQRELDLKEVNTVLSKLKPLVEGK